MNKKVKILIKKNLIKLNKHQNLEFIKATVIPIVKQIYNIKTEFLILYKIVTTIKKQTKQISNSTKAKVNLIFKTS